MPDQSGRTAVVTGANSGIGLETAKALAAKGAEVVLGCRSPERGAAALRSITSACPEARVRLEPLDLGQLGSVQAFARRLRQQTDRLDLLINNAGVMMPPNRQETADGFELQIGVNHLGHFALTVPLLELLLATPESRVVNVSSSAQNFGRLDLDDLHWTRRPFRRMASYGASKLANMLFTVELQRRFDAAGSRSLAVACHPGWTATNLQRSTWLFRRLNPWFAMTPWQGALPTLYAATAPDAEASGYYGPDGVGTLRGYPVPNRPAQAGRDPEAARRLWDLSEQDVARSPTG